jgi:hypothetical protein
VARSDRHSAELEFSVPVDYQPIGTGDRLAVKNMTFLWIQIGMRFPRTRFASFSPPTARGRSKITQIGSLAVSTEASGMYSDTVCNGHMTTVVPPDLDLL